MDGFIYILFSWVVLNMKDKEKRESKKDESPTVEIPTMGKFKPGERFLQKMGDDDGYRHHVRTLADMGDPLHAYIMGCYCERIQKDVNSAFIYYLISAKGGFCLAWQRLEEFIGTYRAVFREV